MNREIKFRFWNKISKKHQTLKIGNYDDINNIFKEKNLIPEQFTGLTDKNGVEIFEGDIVRVKYWYDADYGEVKFLPEQTSFVWYPKGLIGVDEPGVVIYRELRNGAYGVEVLGNIHEHKHLLEG